MGKDVWVGEQMTATELRESDLPELMALVADETFYAQVSTERPFDEARLRRKMFEVKSMRVFRLSANEGGGKHGHVAILTDEGAPYLAFHSPLLGPDGDVDPDDAYGALQPVFDALFCDEAQLSVFVYYPVEHLEDVRDTFEELGFYEREGWPNVDPAEHTAWCLPRAAYASVFGE